MDMPNTVILLPRPLPQPRLEQVSCACGQQLLVVRHPRDPQQRYVEECDSCRRESFWRQRD